MRNEKCVLMDNKVRALAPGSPHDASLLIEDQHRFYFSKRVLFQIINLVSEGNMMK